MFLLESRMLPPNKNPSLFFPSLLYFITQTPEESKAASVRPGMLQHLSLDQQHSIAAGAARTAGRAAPSFHPSSPPPTPGLISHGCSFNNPFLPPRRAPQGRRKESAKRSVSSPQKGNLARCRPKTLWWQRFRSSRAIKIAAISISFISGGEEKRTEEESISFPSSGHSGIFSARPTRTWNFPNTFDSPLWKYWPSSFSLPLCSSPFDIERR